ncbi:MAG: AraC family transcriptional regulator, partial [Planctomycetota bacterium]
MSDGARVTKAIRFIEERWRNQPGLGEVAAAVGLSGPHFQRLFRRWAGVSPKRF